MGSKFNSEQTMEIEGGALDGSSTDDGKTYLCIDLKSFYASVECADRGLDPFTTNLVVADPTRSANTICLAITPALKAQGVKNRCRLGDIPDGIEFTCAMPRMSRYMEVSANIVGAYQRFVSADDMHVYSIDESFIDATPYLRLYGMDAKSFARMLMNAAFECAGVTATAGIGMNLLMAKVALDVCAKHAPDGIGVLDDDSWKREIWFHRPITDIWGIGPGIARRLERHGVFDLAGICTLPQKSIMKEFGKNGLFLLDHAWGAGTLHDFPGQELQTTRAFHLERAGAHARLRLQRGENTHPGDGARVVFGAHREGARRDGRRPLRRLLGVELQPSRVGRRTGAFHGCGRQREASAADRLRIPGDKRTARAL